MDHYPTALQPLLAYSAKIGRDRSLVQGAGGNTSVKFGDVMWVKASGTWLSDALTQDIMVPLSVRAVKDVLASPIATDLDFLKCVKSDLSPNGLRPSVETPIHAALDFKFVIHTHEVETVTTAIQQTSQQKFEQALEGLPWRYVPYIKPGVVLGRELQELKSPGDRVFVLENHGLVVCGSDLDEVEHLTTEVRTRLMSAREENAPLVASEPCLHKLDISGTGYRFADDTILHLSLIHI